MPLSFCPFFHVRVLFYVQLKLHPLSYLLCQCPFLFFSMSSQFNTCSDGLGVSVVVSHLRGHGFDFMLEQFLLKTKAVNSGLRNRNMIRKIPTWWENSVHRNRKTAGKIPVLWEISLSGRKKVFRCMDSLVLRHPSYRRGFTYPFSFSVYTVETTTSAGF